MTAQTAQVEPTPTDLRFRMPAYIALTLVAWIASGTFLVAKQTTITFDPLDLAFFRINLGFLAVLAMYRWHARGKIATPIAKRDYWRIAIMGLSGITGNQILFLTGIKYASPIDGALLYAFTPVVVLLAARFLLNETFTWLKVTGIAVAIVGVILVLTGRGLKLAQENLFGDLILLVAVIMWAIYTLIGKDLMGRYDAARISAWTFGVGAVSIIPLAPFTLYGFDWSGPGTAGWLGLMYLSFLTSALAFTLWTWALKRLDAGQVAVFTNLQPALTAFLAWIFLSELPTLSVVVGGILVVGGVVLVQKKPKPRIADA